MSPILKNTLSDFPPLVPFELDVLKLVVLTGKNGAGKSRLLRGLVEGKISYVGLKGEPLTRDQIKLIPSDYFVFQGAPLQLQTVQSLHNDVGIGADPISTQVTKFRQSFIRDGDGSNSTDAERDEADRNAYELLRTHLFEGKTSDSASLLQGVLEVIERMFLRVKEKEHVIEKEEYFRLILRTYFLKFEQGIFVTTDNASSIDLLAFFEMWRRAYADNEHNRYLASRGSKTALSLTDEEFAERYGREPWDVLNEILKESGTDLQFRIDKERLIRPQASFGQLLLEDNFGNRFPPTSISSGEKVIFQIATGRYIAATKQIDYVKPKLVLFDEPDAHLHPSLTQLLLDTLKREYIDQGINVIMTTHSPTTVGLAEEGSVVFMEKNTAPVKKSRRDTVNELLYGQEKLFLDLSGTKIVFVEDESDVKRISKLVEILLRHCENEGRPLFKESGRLTFKSLSRKTLKNETLDGGKGGVRKLVNTVGDDKNVVGLIDFDGNERPGAGIYVLCEDERYGIENLLLDPRILVCLLLQHDLESYSGKFGLQIESFEEIKTVSEDAMQQCMNLVQEEVLGEPEGEQLSIEYEDGLRFDVRSDWLLKQGHDLYKLVDDQYHLRRKSPQDDHLLRICKHTIREKPGFLPVSFRKSIEALLV